MNYSKFLFFSEFYTIFFTHSCICSLMHAFTLACSLAYSLTHSLTHPFTLVRAHTHKHARACAHTHTHAHTHRHIGNSEAIVPYDGCFHCHDRVWHVSPATTQHNWLTVGFSAMYCCNRITCFAFSGFLKLLIYCRT